MKHSFLGRATGLVAGIAALGLSACGGSDEEPYSPGVSPGLAGDSGVGLPAPDTGITQPAPGVDSGAPSPGTPGGSPGGTPGGSPGGTPGGMGGADAGAVGGSTDTPWCKAKAVLEQRCTSCHDGEGTAGTPNGVSFSNIDHLQQTGVNGQKYFQRIGVRIRDANNPMPPARNATEDELKTLEAWIAAGGSGGANPTCTPPGGSDAGTADGGGVDAGPQWPADCEKRYKITSHAPNSTGPFMVPPGQEIHPQVIWDAPWGNEEVQAIAMLPITDNKKVLHHWILYEQGGGAFITGWAPGAEDAAPLPSDVGMYIAKGPQSLRLDMHYYNKEGTQAEPDASGVEICVVSKPKFRKHTATVFNNFASFGNIGLEGLVMVPPNASNHAITGVCNVTTTEPVTLLTASPHAHTFARSMRFTATVGGQQITMHEGPFEFEEQRSYGLKQPIVLKTGDKVSTTCVYSNTTNRAVTFGEDTGNEMCFNFAVYYPKGALSCSPF